MKQLHKLVETLSLYKVQSVVFEGQAQTTKYKIFFERLAEAFRLQKVPINELALEKTTHYKNFTRTLSEISELNKKGENQKSFDVHEKVKLLRNSVIGLRVQTAKAANSKLAEMLDKFAFLFWIMDYICSFG